MPQYMDTISANGNQTTEYSGDITERDVVNKS